MTASLAVGSAVELRSPDPALFDALRPVARAIFTDTFAGRYAAAPFAEFCDATYGPDGAMAREFTRADVAWQVATGGGEPIGYAKLTPLRAPATDPAPDAAELQQLYVRADWHGTGVADRLMDWALAESERRGAPEIYLTVFDHNERAKRFYSRRGFSEVGRCTFTLGDRVDDDRIWRRPLVDRGGSCIGAISTAR